jgi:hypothetical protein
VAKDVIISYSIPNDIEIIDPEPNLKRDNQNIVYKMGTIFSNESVAASFKVSSTRPGMYIMGSGPASAVEYTNYRGTTSKVPIRPVELEIDKKEVPIPPINNSTSPLPHLDPIEEADKFGSEFNLMGQGKIINKSNQETDVKVRKIIERNEITNLPRITIQIITPPIKNVDFVLAVDSSGSMNQSEEYTKAITEGIPNYLSQLEKKYKDKDIRVSIVSWDEDNLNTNNSDEFAYGDIKNNNYADARLVPLNRTTTDAKKLFEKYKNICGDTEGTHFNAGLNASVAVFDNKANKPKPAYENNTSKFILFITGKSEFKKCDDYVLKQAIDRNLKVATFGIDLTPDCTMENELEKISSMTGGHYLPCAATSGQLQTRLEDELENLTKSMINSTVASNVSIVETLYPYLIPVEESITGATLINVPIQNADKTRTLYLSVENLSPDTTWNVSFDVMVDMRLPIDVAKDRYTNRTYAVAPPANE